MRRTSPSSRPPHQAAFALAAKTPSASKAASTALFAASSLIAGDANGLFAVYKDCAWDRLILDARPPNRLERGLCHWTKLSTPGFFRPPPRPPDGKSAPMGWSQTEMLPNRVLCPMGHHCVSTVGKQITPARIRSSWSKEARILARA